MEIRKRNGESVPFQQEKIFNAMKKAFDGQGKEIGSREMDEILATVLNNLSVTVPLTVERVQDEVERTLMERGHYEVAKAYILYREKRSALRRVRHTIARTVGDDSLDEVLRRIQMDFTEEVYSLAALQMKFESFCRPGMTEDERAEALTKAAVELTTAEAPKWEFIAARLLNHSFRCRNAQEWEGRGVCDLYGKLRYLTDKGLYGDYILAHYTHEEIAMAEDFLCPERDELFTYSGLDLLLKRYVIQSRSRVPLETPQEMFLGIALHLAMNEGSDRMGWVKRFYDMLSRMEVTMATPTMSNARKPYHSFQAALWTLCRTVWTASTARWTTSQRSLNSAVEWGCTSVRCALQAAPSAAFKGRRAVLSAGSGWSTTPPWRWISWGCGRALWRFT